MKEGEKMFVGLSKTLSKFGGFRLGIGMRITKNNMIWMSLLIMVVQLFKAVWYLMIIAFWIMYAMFYGLYWCIKKSIPFLKALYQKPKVNIKKEGNQA